jgi:hypothetical protein
MEGGDNDSKAMSLNLAVHGVRAARQVRGQHRRIKGRLGADDADESF